MNQSKFFFILIITILTNLATYAMPAFSGSQVRKQSDGTEITFVVRGDEHLHALYTTDGYLLAESADGSLFYAQIGTDGKPEATATLAHNASQRSADEEELLSQTGKISFSYLSSVMGQKSQTTNLKRLAELKDGGRTTFPTIGAVKGLVLLVEFADNEFEYEQTDFDRMMNEPEFSEYESTGCAADFFAFQSMGRFTPSFDVVGPIKLSRNMSYYGSNSYGGNDSNPAEMIVDACNIAHDDFDIDFSQYDFDDDGYVDFVYAIYAGYGESYGAPSYTIWPHQSTLEDNYITLTLDGKTVNRYACSCELKYTTGIVIEGIGTFCHEFSHVLGLPDFYQTNSGNETQFGEWSIMDQGCYNNNSRTPAGYSGFERYCLGWLEYEDITEAAIIDTLPALSTSNRAMRLTSDDPDEYFVLETRQQTDWDSYLPAEGLMITHIHYDETIWQNNSVNNSSSHPRYYLMAADGTHGYNSDGDLFPGTSGNTQFTDFSTPSSLLWDGTRLNKSITGIKYAEGITTFAVMQDKLTQPLGVSATAESNNAFAIEWDEVSNALSYTLTAYEILSDDIKPVPLDEPFSLMTLGNYPMLSKTDCSADLDTLTLKQGWHGTNVHQAGGYCCVGTSGKVGTLTTPKISLGSESLTFAIAVRAYTGRSLNATFSVSYGSFDIYSEKMKITSTADTIYISIPAQYDEVSLTITANKERLFVDRLKVVRGLNDETLAWQTENPKIVITDLTEPTAELTDLNYNSTYEVYVQAISADELCNSPLSDVLTLNTLASEDADDVITPVSIINNAQQPYKVYNLAGQYITTINTISQVKILPRGIYILTNGSEKLKVEN